MHYVFHDLDMGIDDALALAYSLSQKNIKVVGISTVFGNVSTAQSGVNTKSILTLLGHEEIPVFQGDACPTGETDFSPSPVVKQIHGDNGIGNLTPPPPQKSYKGSAITGLEAGIERYGKELTIIPTGPLTNIAALYQGNPTLIEKSGKLVIMGGVLNAKGNVTEFAEANIYKDPKAADYLFSLPLDITLIGLDVTERTFLKREDTTHWTNRAGLFFASLASYYMDHTEGGKDKCFLHDPSAVIAAENSALFTYATLPLEVVQSGPRKGALVRSGIRKNQIKVATAALTDEIAGTLCRGWNDLFSEC